MNALKSQFEGKCLRLERELKELRETQAHTEQREDSPDQSGTKVHSCNLYLGRLIPLSLHITLIL